MIQEQQQLPELLPITVAAFTVRETGRAPEKMDQSTLAAFANSDRAEAYALMLANEYRYPSVILWDAEGTAWEVPATPSYWNIVTGVKR